MKMVESVVTFHATASDMDTVDLDELSNLLVKQLERATDAVLTAVREQYPHLSVTCDVREL